MKKLLAIIIFNLVLCSVVFSQWQEANKGLYGGHIGGLFFDPVSNQLFAGTGNCGIFVSSDVGQHWKTSNKGLPQQAYNVESFLRSGKNLFMGCNYIGGVFLSTDNGKTWIYKKNGFPEYNSVHCLAQSGTKLFAGTFNGVYVSTDNGENWTAVNNGLTQMDQYINTIAVKDGKIFVGSLGGIFVSSDDGGTWTKSDLGLDYSNVQAIAVAGGNIYAGAPLGKFCISSDNGSSWISVNSGLPFGVDFKELIVNNGIIYGGTAGAGVCVSTDNGNTWKQFNNTLSKKTINKLAIKGNKIFAATEAGVFLSNDNCNSWVPVNNELTNIPVTCMVKSGTRLLAGTRGSGLFSSTDNGRTWAQINNVTTSEAPWFFALTAKDNYVIAGTTDGEYVSSDNGLTWVKGDFSLPEYYNIGVEESVIIGDKIFAVTVLGVYMSVDNGKTWTTNGALKDEGLFSLATSGNTLYAGTCAGVFMSTDLGTTWTNINNGFPITDNCIMSICTKENNIFIASNSGVFVSNNNGSSWTAVNNGFPSLSISAISVYGNNLFSCAYANGVFLSTNNGTSWAPVNTGLAGPAMAVNSINVIGDYVYAGTDKGVWKRPLSEFSTLSVSPTAVNIAAPENSTASFNITSNTDWSIQSFEDWFTLSKASGSGNATINLTAYANHSKTPRKATVIVSGYAVKSQAVLVTQNGRTDKIKTNDIDIYPNPATDHLTLTIGDSFNNPDYTIKIMNVVGTVVYETKINQTQYEVNITSWKMKGAYVLQVINNCKQVALVKTIIVQ
jgi:photosystem II stability/assembly factor-like uncharacterized protein